MRYFMPDFSHIWMVHVCACVREIIDRKEVVNMYFKAFNIAPF
mgnify:CR=1 FL=1